MKRDIIAEMKQDLGMTKKKRSLMEALLNDDEEFGMGNNYDDVAPMPAGEEEMADTDVTSDDVDIDGAIDEIRQIALKTIAKLAADPTDDKYQLMKKIWTLCDKTIEDKINAAKGEGNNKPM